MGWRLVSLRKAWVEPCSRFFSGSSGNDERGLTRMDEVVVWSRLRLSGAAPAQSGAWHLPALLGTALGGSVGLLRDSELLAEGIENLMILLPNMQPLGYGAIQGIVGCLPMLSRQGFVSLLFGNFRELPEGDR